MNNKLDLCASMVLYINLTNVHIIVYTCVHKKAQELIFPSIYLGNNFMCFCLVMFKKYMWRCV